LATLKREFPSAQVFVASQEVKENIMRFALAAEKHHWLDDEPLMLPKSANNLK